MLHELRIENLLVIERAEMRFGEGLNAITGETGAGKTVLAHALDLLLGGRARPNIVRPGAEEAWVEGTFELPERALDEPGLEQLAERLPPASREITVGRRVGASGRTSAFVGGRSASAADLRLLGERLVAFYGQHDHRKLTVAAAQMDVLDGFAGGEQIELRSRYRDAHTQVGALEAELAELREREGARERDLDLLRFELDEIEHLAPDPEESAGLEQERERLRHAEALREAAAGALALVDGDGDGIEGGARGAAAQAAQALDARSGIDPKLDSLAERATACAIELGELAASLRDAADQLDSDPARLEQLEERLQAIDRLERKHGGTIEAVLAHGERCRTRIAALERSEERAGELDAELSEARALREQLAGRLTRGRERAASELEAKVASELAHLAMDGARLVVALEPCADGFAAGGAESVELRIATNPGMPITPLREAASGGELSRVMLALSCLGGAGSAASVVFDEIDAGIGGNTARAVGERLRRLGERRQVICITHLPQVASLASTHFRIVKELAGEAATASVERVGGDELVDEIVRMLGAETGDSAAAEHARELLAA